MSANSSRKLSRAIHSQKLFNFTSHIFIYFIFLHFLANKFTFSASILRYRYGSHGQSNCALFYHRRHPIGLPAKALYVKAYSDLFCKGICYRFIVLLRFFFSVAFGILRKGIHSTLPRLWDLLWILEWKRRLLGPLLTGRRMGDRSQR